MVTTEETEPGAAANSFEPASAAEARWATLRPVDPNATFSEGEGDDVLGGEDKFSGTEERAESSSGEAESSPSLVKEYSETLAEKVLSQAIQITELEEELKHMRKAQAASRKAGERVIDPAGAASRQRAKKDKMDVQQTVFQLSELLEKAERRATEYQKRVNTATQALRTKDRELKTLRASSERHGRESEKLAKSNAMLQSYVERLEGRLAAAVNTKDDREKMEGMQRKLSSLKGDKDALQRKLSDTIEENILLSESLNEIRSLIDTEALSLGLESGEVLVELTAQKQARGLLESQIEAQRKDNALLVGFVKDLRLTHRLEGAEALALKLSNPIVEQERDLRNAEEMILARRLETVQEEIKLLGGTVKAQEEREQLLLRSSQEERTQLSAAVKELGESKALCDSLALESQTYRKKCVRCSRSTTRSQGPFSPPSSSLSRFR